MLNDAIIHAEGLGKKYVIGHEVERERYTALRDVIARRTKVLLRTTSDMLRGRAIVAGDTTEEIWALKDVDFEIKRGEAVGVIGRNGAGKSTLLKILSRITEPTAGQVEIRGRVASLLEVGTGFHPELTGRENIYLNGAILGMARAEIRRKFDEIVDFSGTEKFLDTPVKRYSSGMYLRLAFSVAAHLEPEILLVDEVLAVGDAEFQTKCLGKMRDVSGHGRTVLFVSHNLAAIEALCPRCLHFEAGGIRQDSTSHKVISSYLATQECGVDDSDLGRQVGSSLSVIGIRLSERSVSVGEMLSGELHFAASGEGHVRECAILIHSLRGPRVAIIDLRKFGVVPLLYATGAFVVRFEIPALPLVEGAYSLGLYIATDEFNGNIDNLVGFDVLPSRRNAGFIAYAPESCGIFYIDARASLARSVD